MSNKKAFKFKIRGRIKLLLIMFILLMLIPVGITFSKYVHDFIGDYLIKTSNFYFSSDKLSNPAITYRANNWSGVSNFKIQFSLNNHKNNLLVSDSDIDYSLNIQTPSDVTSTITSVSGTIYKSEMTDNYEAIITPQRVFNTGESVTVTVTATSSAPYIKELKAYYIITVGRQGISYEIEDEVNRPYLNLTITNARDNYIAGEAFGNYEINHSFTVDEYMALSASEKAKCYSARITLSFDPTDVIIDTTSNLLNNSSHTTTTVNGVAYISSITFDVDPMSSNVIRFYKLDVSQDYTFPHDNDPSIITFNAL